MQVTENFDGLSVEANNSGYFYGPLTRNGFVFTDNTGSGRGMYSVSASDENMGLYSAGAGNIVTMTDASGGNFTFHSIAIEDNSGYSGTVALYGGSGSLGSKSFSSNGIVEFNGGVADVTRVVLSSSSEFSFFAVDDIVTSPTVTNTAPTLSGLPSDLALKAGVSSPDLSAVSLSDADGDTLSLTLQAGGGTLSASGANGVTVEGTGTGTLTLRGGASSIETFLDTPANIAYDSGATALGNDSTTLILTASDGTESTAPARANIDLAEADSLVVTTASDAVDVYDNQTSLREAVAFANSNADASTITFATALDDATITLGGTELVLSSNVTIDGDIGGDGKADITIDADDKSRVFNVTAGEATLDALTVTGGNTNAGGGLDINSGASATVTGSTFVGNKASGGGAIFNAGILDLKNSLLTENTVDVEGGGIANFGTATVTGTTISGNSVVDEFDLGFGGGGVHNGNTGTIDIVNSTVTGNTASGSDFGGSTTLRGGGIHSVGTVTLNNSIVVGNTGTVGSENIYGTVGTTASVVDVDAATVFGTNTLTDNGGPVQTIALRVDASNSALDIGSSGLNTDANGNARDVDLAGVDNGGTVDAGAVEAAPVIDTGSAGNDRMAGTTLGDTLDGGTGNDRIAGGVGGDSLNGGAGIDTLDYVHSASGVTVDLGNDTASGGDAAGDTIANFERVFGSRLNDTVAGDEHNNGLFGNAGDDTLDGAAGNDLLRGGRGADSIDGGAGIDLADYRSSFAGVTVDLTAGTGSGGTAAGDTLTRVENLRGSAHADTLTGDTGRNVLIGNAGDDTLDGSAGHDVLRGGAGADRLNGGSGADAADYRGSAAGVTVDLGGNTASGGDATGDVLSGIERLFGSGHADTLTGTDQKNLLVGGAGDDILDGGEGNDLLIGGAGADRFLFGADDGDDTITDFADGTDMLVFAAGSGIIFLDLLITAENGDAVVTYGNSEIVVEGAAGNIDALDFAF